MTNEEIVIRIQAGQTELIPRLWEQTERFVKSMAVQLMRKLAPCAGVELADLVQSGYLALTDAVKRYEQERGASFISVLAMSLKTAFAECAGYRRTAQRSNPLTMKVTASLDAPLSDDGEIDMTLHDVVSDDQEPYRDIETRIFQEQLHDAVEEVFTIIGQEHASILKYRFVEGMTLKEISERDGRSQERIRQLEGQALRRTRGQKCSRILQPFYLELRTPYFLNIGSKRFQLTGSRTVEEIVLIREKLRERL